MKTTLSISVILFSLNHDKILSADKMLWFSLDECQVPSKSALSLPLLNWTGQKTCDERLMGHNRHRKRSLTDYCHGQNIQLGGGEV